MKARSFARPKSGWRDRLSRDSRPARQSLTQAGGTDEDSKARPGTRRAFFLVSNRVSNRPLAGGENRRSRVVAVLSLGGTVIGV